jgi:uncharacterized membrane protein YeaQ/YmgE (transglycosylase-associated protein family)
VPARRLLPLDLASQNADIATQRLFLENEQPTKEEYMEIIGVIIAGIIIGLLGKFVAPSTRDNIPIWLTILCGIGGVIIGWYVYVLFGGNGSPGIDWTRWLLAIVVAAVLVIAADAIMVRSKSRRTQV